MERIFVRHDRQAPAPWSGSLGEIHERHGRVHRIWILRIATQLAARRKAPVLMMRLLIDCVLVVVRAGHWSSARDHGRLGGARARGRVHGLVGLLLRLVLLGVEARYFLRVLSRARRGLLMLVVVVLLETRRGPHFVARVSLLIDAAGLTRWLLEQARWPDHLLLLSCDAGMLLAKAVTFTLGLLDTVARRPLEYCFPAHRLGDTLGPVTWPHCVGVYAAATATVVRRECVFHNRTALATSGAS